MRSVFLAMPVSDNLASDGRFRPERRQFFEGIVHAIHSTSVHVLSAGTNEDWGAIRLSPSEFTRYDLDSIATADALVVVTNERLNRDMYLETGLALGRGIPVIFVIPASTHLTFMALGMEKLGVIEVHRYDADADAAQLVGEALARRLGQLPAAT